MGSKATVTAMALAGLVTTGCASTNGQQSNPQDPWEGYNRAVFSFNDTLDRYALKPVAEGYDYVTPEPVQDGVGNFFNNLGEVGNFLNSLMQWKLSAAGVAGSRFLLNTTLGLGGLLDPAGRMGLERQPEDFGQTLATWGVGQGPYLVWPFLGPSTVRDSAGFPVNWYTDPVTYIDDDPTRWSFRALDIVDTRAGLLDQESLMQGDRYSFVRDAYLQRRQFLINDGKATKDPFASGDVDFNDDDFAQ
ncbi:MlaA family lipoprotein [Larsenimonas salina]|uniref:MlaA family lipoprotein n=1 Tax=Larsenimonas salina TaxID=1295565 RepID=UPI002073D1B7|nr:VacJ family lipoprotein [Larsenimonas salina]MCM5705756.1 VacJ family lipoprotein [Larsenimonas salina]